MPRGRPRKGASRESYGAWCCRRPNLHRVQRLVHGDGPVVRCNANHRARYFVVSSSAKGTFEVARADLETLAALPDTAPKRRGRVKGVPPEKRPLLPHEKEAVEGVIRAVDNKTNGADTDVASLARRDTWVTGEALDAALARVCASAAPGVRCGAHTCLFFRQLYMDRQEYDYGRVRRWTLPRRGKPALDVFSLDVLFVPIKHGNTHWALAVVDVAGRSLAYMDSMLPGSEKKAAPVFRALRRYLADEWNDKGKVGEAPAFAVAAVDRDAPQQGNSDDCGVFVLAYAEAIAHGRPLSRTALQRYMPYHRERFAAEVQAAAGRKEKETKRE